MDLELDGKVAMVAAASKGLGKACARALASAGCRVSICARNAATLEEARAEVGAELASAVDVSRAEDLTRWHAETVARLGPADILITNTGGPPAARFLGLSDELWQGAVDSTLMNVIRLCRLVLPAMQARRWGRVIHLTSFVAREPVEELTISSTLRAGLSALTRTMASQFGPDGITVNAVLMGHILTGRQEHLAELRAAERGITQEEYFRQSAASVPLRRLGRADEVGDVVAFLASQRASYVTGVSLPVDGGLVRSTF
jgi:3-oxoacyl-[acyl-carrier protein] reductase